jgi:hypothetical protein
LPCQRADFRGGEKHIYLNFVAYGIVATAMANINMNNYILILISNTLQLLLSFSFCVNSLLNLNPKNRKQLTPGTTKLKIKALYTPQAPGRGMVPAKYAIGSAFGTIICTVRHTSPPDSRCTHGSSRICGGELR